MEWEDAGREEGNRSRVESLQGMLELSPARGVSVKYFQDL